MSTFKKYSTYYNLLYQDKNYEEEVEYVEKLIKRHSEIPVSEILDMGSGTGRHDFIFAQKNYHITGIDLSEEMTHIAQAANVKNTEFHTGDVRSIELDKQFDAVISLFHVASYQTTNEDFVKYLQTAKKHIKPGGVFIFDFWYGPAVLSDKPTTRIKRLENNEIQITRLTESEILPNSNIVNVKFEVLIEDKENGELTKTQELHPMRYWFYPEIEYFCKHVGFKIERSFQWMTETELSLESWNGVVVLKL